MTTLKSKPFDGLIRWGILGCGDVTEIKSGPALRKIPGSTLTAVMRRDADKARDYARRHGVPRWYGNAGDLVADPEVDAVYVASPPGAHLELGRLAAQAGKPCYVEKPMGASSSVAQGLIAAFAQSGRPLFPAYYRRGLRKKFRKVAELSGRGRSRKSGEGPVCPFFQRPFDLCELASRSPPFRRRPLRRFGKPRSRPSRFLVRSPCFEVMRRGQQKRQG